MRPAVTVMALAAAAVLSRAPAAAAHELRPCVLDLRELGGGRYEVTWKAASGAGEGSRGEPAAPRFPERCHPEAAPGEPREPGAAGVVAEAEPVARWILACDPGSLAGQPVAVTGLSLGKTDALVRFTGADGAEVTAVLRADAPSWVVPGSGARPRVAPTYFGAGVEHLLTGWDHLLFVLGLLLLVPRPRALVATITAFTAAHSVSLALSVSGLLRVPAAPAEAAIALSLLLLARELARPGDPGAPTLARRSPWVMAFAFGLIHGLGFAGGLRALGLPPGQIPLALLMFNLGLEAGQLALVAALLGLLRVSRRASIRTSKVPPYVIGALASFWCLQRVASFWKPG